MATGETTLQRRFLGLITTLRFSGRRVALPRRFEFGACCTGDPGLIVVFEEGAGPMWQTLLGLAGAGGLVAI